MLQAIFYARFHPRRGPSVIHQHPSEAIIAHNSVNSSLFNFSDITSYVIPPHELCNRALSVCTNGYRVLGFPISLAADKYELTERNRFTFNVCFVLTDSEPATPWERIVSKTASFFACLEETEGLLHAEEQLDGLKWAGDKLYPAVDVGRVYELLRSVFTQLNLYGETYVGVGNLHVLNLRLVSPESSGHAVRPWDVPLLIRNLPDADEWTWDLPLQQIHPYIDGVNHVQRIAELADVEVGLVGKTVRELLRHQRVILLDIFHFQAVYALTADFECFVKDEEAKEECVRYAAKKDAIVSYRGLVELYRGLSHGTSIKDFYVAHETELSSLDIRRFITFGVIKGFLRRVQKFAFSLDGQEAASSALPSSDDSPTKTVSSIGQDKERDQAWKRAAFSSGWATPPVEPSADGAARPVTTTETENLPKEGPELRVFLDGKHCMDEICVLLRLTEKRALEKLRIHADNVIVFSK